MQIVDCFPYFNEKELLELRINLLHDYVDRFIITDANHTHKGDPKPFTCKETLKQLGLLSDKIQVIEVNLPSNKRFKSAWIRERMQRDEAVKYFSDDTIAYVSDCDEIINPEYIEYYIDMIQKIPYDVYRVPLMNLQGSGDLQVHHRNGNPEEWNAPFFCVKRHFKEHSLSYIRENISNPLCDKEQISYRYNQQNFGNASLILNGEYLKYAGWHFTWMGDLSNRTNKLNSFLHWDEFDYVKNPKENSTDVLGRNDFYLKKISHDLLPKKLFETERIKNFLLPNIEIKNEISVVQIGTNRSNDSLSNYLLSNFSNLTIGLFVEPYSIFNEEIKKCYKKYKNIFIENIAIVPINCSENAQIEMFYHTGDPTYETTSCKKEHLFKHQQFYNEGEIKTFYVNCMSLEQLFDKYNIKELDWLLLDIEGMDSDIILSFNWEKYDIKRIEFEWLHLKDKTDIIEKKFYDMGYKKVNSIHQFDWAFEK